MHATPIEDDSCYKRLILPLVDLAVVQFHVSRLDAELIAHDVLMANIRYLEADNLETRLTAAMTTALRARCIE